MSDVPLPQSEIILYQTEDGRTRVQRRFENETVWLTQALIADLFQVTAPTVNEHLMGIYADGELDAEATIRNFRIVRLEGARQVTREIERYSLPVILAVGYLDEFLKISGRKLLDHTGKISAEAAKAKAELEYARYQAFLDTQPHAVDVAFEKASKELSKLPRPRKPKPPQP